MNTFDVVTEQCFIAQEGSTKDAIAIMEGDTFKNAIQTTKKAIQSMNSGNHDEAISLLTDAKEYFNDARKQISSLRTYPISAILGGSIPVLIYTWNTLSKSIDPEVLGIKKAKDLSFLTKTADVIASILQFIMNPGTKIGLDTGYAIRNKIKNGDQPAKLFNTACAKFIYIIDFYIDRCDFLISKCQKLKKGELVADESAIIDLDSVDISPEE